jgi:hypothetical protein
MWISCGYDVDIPKMTKMAEYSLASLIRKLGIEEHTKVFVLHARKTISPCWKLIFFPVNSD